MSLLSFLHFNIFTHFYAVMFGIILHCIWCYVVNTADTKQYYFDISLIGQIFYNKGGVTWMRCSQKARKLGKLFLSYWGFDI